MGVQGVGRAAAAMRGAVVCLVVLGGAVGPASVGSAQPARLVAGEWYRVTPAADHHISGAVAAVTAHTDPVWRDSHSSAFPSGTMAWLAVASCLLILATGLFRSVGWRGTRLVRRLPIGAVVSPRGAKKNV
jgi:hypothetical protein